MKAAVPKVSLSQCWLLFWNISIFALTVCILSGCRSNSEKNYSLINYDRTVLTTILGDECFNASTSLIGDTYKLGLSGSCRVRDGATNCTSHLPPVLSFSEPILLDMSSPTTAVNKSTILEKCRELIEEKPIDHALSQRLAVAIFALLITSIVLNIISLALSTKLSVFGKVVFVPLLLDALVLVVCIGIFLGILQYEVGGYLPDDKKTSIPGTAFLGIGFWMLIAIFGARLISHPALFISFLVLALLVPIGFILIILYMIRCTAILSPITRIVVFYD